MHQAKREYNEDLILICLFAWFKQKYFKVSSKETEKQRKYRNFTNIAIFYVFSLMAKLFCGLY